MLAIARVDGWSIVVVAAFSTLWSLWQGAWVEVEVSVFVGMAGVTELVGRRMLLKGNIRGVSSLIGAQLYLLVVIWTYAVWRWYGFEPQVFWESLPSLAQAEIDRQLVTAGLELEPSRPLFLEVMNATACFLLAGITLFYQGGLALYYSRQRERIRQALVSDSA